MSDPSMKVRRNMSTCATKTGAPDLCSSCLHNRALAAALRAQIDELVIALVEMSKDIDAHARVIADCAQRLFRARDLNSKRRAEANLRRALKGWRDR